jgi:hypothetical protein
LQSERCFQRLSRSDFIGKTRKAEQVLALNGQGETQLAPMGQVLSDELEHGRHGRMGHG